ncbi:MAG TPA: hypothetical protein VLV48_10435, partial [Thermoanaerobaculia bacterium]|nr:hypothetical protein [Thermoanaerobaculia bacterium]
ELNASLRSANAECKMQNVKSKKRGAGSAPIGVTGLRSASRDPFSIFHFAFCILHFSSDF